MSTRGMEFPVFIRSLTGQVIQVIVTGSDTVFDLKCKIQDKNNIPVTHMRLLFQGKQLVDTNTLDTYNISKEQIISMIVKIQQQEVSKEEPTSSGKEEVSIPEPPKPVEKPKIYGVEQEPCMWAMFVQRFVTWWASVKKPFLEKHRLISQKWTAIMASIRHFFEIHFWGKESPLMKRWYSACSTYQTLMTRYVRSPIKRTRDWIDRKSKLLRSLYRSHIIARYHQWRIHIESHYISPLRKWHRVHGHLIRSQIRDKYLDMEFAIDTFLGNFVRSTFKFMKNSWIQFQKSSTSRNFKLKWTNLKVWFKLKGPLWRAEIFKLKNAAWERWEDLDIWMGNHVRAIWKSMNPIFNLWKDLKLKIKSFLSIFNLKPYLTKLKTAIWERWEDLDIWMGNHVRAIWKFLTQTWVELKNSRISTYFNLKRAEAKVHWKKFREVASVHWTTFKLRSKSRAIFIKGIFLKHYKAYAQVHVDAFFNFLRELFDRHVTRGIHSRNFGVEISPFVRILDMRPSNMVVLQMNEGPYSIRIYNKDKKLRANCSIFIDGVDCGIFRLKPRSSYRILRPAKEDTSFIFKKNVGAEKKILDLKNPPLDQGVITVTFLPEYSADDAPRHSNAFEKSNVRSRQKFEHRDEAIEIDGKEEDVVVGAVLGKTEFGGKSGQDVFESEEMKVNFARKEVMNIYLVSKM
eukprot:TRINITY_DN1181_c0_g1_i2.p1 TRINITY_DN1181_c0_g1~~TRINITY_DN1181_c0_g1_i2.p1  ORF type:complete len:684 (+),score=210.41 TRINITY_DN1181_c0_g1_i2:59-2110(+)